MADPLRESSTRELLIEATSRRLWKVDENEIRILDICRETNLSTSVIYAHFGSRQGLIDASLLRVFRVVSDEFVENLTIAVAGPHSTGSFLDTWQERLTNPDYKLTVIAQRRMFFRVSASALSRPTLRSGFLALYDNYMTRVDTLCEELVCRELLGAQLTGHQWALFLEGQMLSRAFHDLSSELNNHDDWNRAAMTMLSGSFPEPLPAPD
jgi:AcrR family transcriptional regulator